MMRIGQGYDVHRLVFGRRLVVGGVHIDHPTGLDGHSDADVLLHAICDALLGAAGLGDIGRHFSPEDESFKDSDSRYFVRQVAKMLQHENCQVSNIDATIIAERPKMAPHIQQMQDNIASDLGVEPSQINIKATTTERLGFEGEEKGIAASAVALIVYTK